MDRKVVYDVDNESFIVKPEAFSDRDWRSILRNRFYVAVYPMVVPYAKVGVAIRMGNDLDGELWDFGYRIEKIAFQLHMTFGPPFVTDYLRIRCAFLAQLIEAHECHSVDFHDGARYDRNRVSFVVTWMFKIFDHFLDGGGVDIVPHFEIFITPHLTVGNIAGMLRRINWMKERFDRKHRTIDTFLEVSGITMDIWNA